MFCDQCCYHNTMQHEEIGNFGVDQITPAYSAWAQLLGRVGLCVQHSSAWIAGCVRDLLRRFGCSCFGTSSTLTASSSLLGPPTHRFLRKKSFLWKSGKAHPWSLRKPPSLPGLAEPLGGSHPWSLRKSPPRMEICESFAICGLWLWSSSVSSMLLLSNVSTISETGGTSGSPLPSGQSSTKLGTSMYGTKTLGKRKVYRFCQFCIFFM